MNKVDEFLSEAISSSCEGIMVTALDDGSEHAPSKHSDSWLKIKRDYVEGLHEVLDLFPIGAWHGNRRKAGCFSPFLSACYDPDSVEYQSVCRIMSGFSDAFYKEMAGSVLLVSERKFVLVSFSPDATINIGPTAMNTFNIYTSRN